MSITAIALCTLGLVYTQGPQSVATVNGEILMSQTYYRRMEYLPGLGRKTNTGQFVEIMPAIATLDTLVTEMLLVQIARAKGLLPTEAETDQEIAYRVRKNPTYITDWQAVGRTMPELRHMIKVEKAQFKIQTDGIVVTETDIQKNYDQAKSTRFTTPARYKLRVITANDEDTKSKVDDGIRAGKSFGDLASQYSTDASKNYGGDFGTVPLEILGEQVKAAIKPLKKGERTGWLSADKIYAKFQVDEILPAEILPLDAGVKEDLRREMMLAKSAGVPGNDVLRMLRDARQRANIAITSPEIDKAYKQFLDLEKKSTSGGQ
jgi:parvulin-like peptidyl-prolyl isomerase